ncbi:hypothetical protein BDN67DRAFT_828085 [Paxillus ammoniavirescens]|nr:hypothetical protein BDN67DRAFT_828085 [Paxillus ammoniavirescens]
MMHHAMHHDAVSYNIIHHGDVTLMRQKHDNASPIFAEVGFLLPPIHPHMVYCKICVRRCCPRALPLLVLPSPQLGFLLLPIYPPVVCCEICVRRCCPPLVLEICPSSSARVPGLDPPSAILPTTSWGCFAIVVLIAIHHYCRNCGHHLYCNSLQHSVEPGGAKVLQDPSQLDRMQQKYCTTFALVSRFAILL